MITILRGSSGSGKSFTAYSLLRDYPNEPVMWPAQVWPNQNKAKSRAMGYIFPGDLFLVGAYTARVCGGMDLIHGGPANQFKFLERAGLKFTHVFAESLMAAVAKTSLWQDLKTALPHQTIIAPTLNTPEEIAIQRIYSRNGGKEIKEHAHRANWRRVHRKREEIEALGIASPYIAYEESYSQLVSWLKWGGWCP